MKTYIQHNIKYLIQRQKWDHATFAAQFDISRAMVSHYVLGKNTPKIETIARIADYFNISIDDIVRLDLWNTKVFPEIGNNNSDQQDSSLLKQLENLEKIIYIQDKFIVSLEEKLLLLPPADNQPNGTI